jgi:hypothetical protein
MSIYHVPAWALIDWGMGRCSNICCLCNRTIVKSTIVNACARRRLNLNILIGSIVLLNCVVDILVHFDNGLRRCKRICTNLSVPCTETLTRALLLELA